jgi:hypothetical protein
VMALDRVRHRKETKLGDETPGSSGWPPISAGGGIGEETVR